MFFPFYFFILLIFVPVSGFCRFKHNTSNVSAMRAIFTFLQDSTNAYEINVFIIYYHLFLRCMQIYMHVVFPTTISIFSDEKVGEIEMVLFVHVLLPFYCFNQHVFESLNKFSQSTFRILLQHTNNAKAPHIKKRQHCFLLIKFINSILVFFPAQYVCRRFCSSSYSLFS